MKTIYFIGIGGTAMASVAAALVKAGYDVTGSDNGVYPPMSGFLEENGIAYQPMFSADNIHHALDRMPLPMPEGRDASEGPLFVIGNAVSRGNPEVEEVLNKRLPYTSLAALIGSEFIRNNTSIVISGTHGKTTTSSLTAWILETAGQAPGFLIGGIPENFRMGCRVSSEGAPFVIEGDEYDTAFFDKRSKFVHYRPTVAIINNIEFDHADIFSSLDEILKSFRQFVNLIPQNGKLIVNGDDQNALKVSECAHCPVQTFGFGAHNDWLVDKITINNETTDFEICSPEKNILKFSAPFFGNHNVMNAAAAIAVAVSLDVTPERIQEGLSSFAGIKRRMEVIGDIADVVVIDDFAHHPTAIRETLFAIRQKYPDRKIWAIFEPRSNTTTRNIFQGELAEAFSDAAHVIIGALNRPDRYSDDERLSPDKLVSDLRSSGVDAHFIPEYSDLVAHVGQNVHPGDVIAILSNGKFGGIHSKILEGLKSKS